jgi:hypothetical protein
MEPAWDFFFGVILCLIGVIFIKEGLLYLKLKKTDLPLIDIIRIKILKFINRKDVQNQIEELTTKARFKTIGVEGILAGSMALIAGICFIIEGYLQGIN